MTGFGGIRKILKTQVKKKNQGPIWIQWYFIPSCILFNGKLLVATFLCVTAEMASRKREKRAWP